MVLWLIGLLVGLAFNISLIFPTLHPLPYSLYYIRHFFLVFLVSLSVFRSLGSWLKSNVRTPPFDLIKCFKEMVTYDKYRYE